MFKPLHNYVLLERIEEENITAGGIIIPDNAKEKPSRGRVIATGNGTYNGDDLVLKFKPKDFNMVEKFSGCKDYVYYEVIFNDKSNEVLKVKAFSKDDKIDVTNYDETLLETVCKK